MGREGWGPGGRRQRSSGPWHGSPRLRVVVAAAGGGEGDRALFLRAHRLCPAGRESGGLVEDGHLLLSLAPSGWGQREGLVSRAVIAVVLGAGGGSGESPWKHAPPRPHMWPCCDT